MFADTGNGCGDTFGDIYEPREYGSGGGSATNSSGLGGGRMHLVVGTVTNDGTIEADGMTGTSGIGGGSGGSIYIQTTSIEGFGYIEVGRVTSRRDVWLCDEWPGVC